MMDDPDSMTDDVDDVMEEKQTSMEGDSMGDDMGDDDAFDSMMEDTKRKFSATLPSYGKSCFRGRPYINSELKQYDVMMVVTFLFSRSLRKEFEEASRCNQRTF